MRREIRALSAAFVITGYSTIADAGPATFTVISPPGSGWSSMEAVGVSGDGMVVACNAGDVAGLRRAARWTRVLGSTLAPGDMIATAISPSGQIVFGSRLIMLGQSPPLFDGLALRWTPGTGVTTFIGPASQTTWNITASSWDGGAAVLTGLVVGQFQTTRLGYIWPESLGMPPQTIPQPEREWTVYDISNDGGTIVGQSGPTSRFGGDARLYRPYVRNLSGTLFRDIRTPMNEEAQGESIAVSGNGAVVVGRLARGNSTDARRGFVWTAAGGTRSLSGIMDDGVSSLPRSVSMNGEKIVGESQGTMGMSVGTVWMGGSPGVDLAALLRSQGAAVPLNAIITYVAEVSDDARTVVGNVRIPDRPDSAFIATFGTPCPADLDDGSGFGIPDGGVTTDDLLYFLSRYETGAIEADLDDGTGFGMRDGGVTVDDLLYYLARYASGC